MMDLPFLSMLLVTGMIAEGADRTGFGGMGVVGVAADEQERKLLFGFDVT